MYLAHMFFNKFEFFCCFSDYIQLSVCAILPFALNAIKFHSFSKTLRRRTGSLSRPVIRFSAFNVKFGIIKKLYMHDLCIVYEY